MRIIPLISRLPGGAGGHTVDAMESLRQQIDQTPRLNDSPLVKREREPTRREVQAFRTLMENPLLGSIANIRDIIKGHGFGPKP